MKRAFATVALFGVSVFGVQAADRQWLMGTWVQVGITRTPFVADPVHERMPPGLNRPEMTQVATYVIETDDRRYELRDLVPIESGGFDRRVTVGRSVTFAVEKKTAYIKLEKGEYRLLVTKNERKKAL